MENCFSVLEYYGKPRFKTDLREYDIIITTYDTLRIDWELWNTR